MSLGIWLVLTGCSNAWKNTNSSSTNSSIYIYANKYISCRVLIFQVSVTTLMSWLYYSFFWKNTICSWANNFKKFNINHIKSYIPTWFCKSIHLYKQHFWIIDFRTSNILRFPFSIIVLTFVKERWNRWIWCK